MRLDQGAPLRCPLTFELDGTIQDPSGVTFVLLTPAGPPATVYVWQTNDELVRDAAGQFHVDVLPSIGGLYVYRFYNEDADKSQCFSAPGSFTVTADTLHA